MSLKFSIHFLQKGVSIEIGRERRRKINADIHYIV